MESRGKPKTGFPRFPQPLEIAMRFPHSHRPATTIYLQNPTPRKEPMQPVASLPPSGSFFNEKMLFDAPIDAASDV
jgi:hypothetical protein